MIISNLYPTACCNGIIISYFVAKEYHVGGVAQLVAREIPVLKVASSILVSLSSVFDSLFFYVASFRTPVHISRTTIARLVISDFLAENANVLRAQRSNTHRASKVLYSRDMLKLAGDLNF